jgi:cytochrome P450
MSTTIGPIRTDPIREYPMARAKGCPFDPSPELMAEQEIGPLTRVRLWDGSTPWLATTFEVQRALLVDPRTSADITRAGFPSPFDPSESAEGSPFSFILMDDPEHSRLRRMVTAPFMVKRINAMRPAIQEIVDSHIDAMLAGPKPVDFVEAFALPVPSEIICELLGVPYSDHRFFQHTSSEILRRDVTPKDRINARGVLADYLYELVDRKLKRPADDLLSGLAERVKAGEITQEGAAQLGWLLLFAGHETTANMIALGTLALLEHPEQLALLQESEDDRVAGTAVEELLRYLNITHSGRRRLATADIDIAGTTIRAGEGIIVPNEIGNRDPEAFDDPNRLDVTRDARHHTAFGFGVHQCLGQPLARAELQIVFGTLYKRIPTLRLATSLDQIRFKNDSQVYGVFELPVSW